MKTEYQSILIAIILYCAIFFTFLYFDSYLSTHYRREYLTIYTTLEYSTFAFILWFLVKNATMKKVISGLSFLFLIFQVYYFFTSKAKTLDSIPIGIETILLLTFITYCFFEQLKKINTQFVYNNFWFWILIGIMTYLACSFFFYIMATSIDFNSIVKYWFITYIFEIIKNILFTTSIIILAKKASSIKKPNNEAIPYLDMI